jgi:F-type H+-transporting ATPase subunit epsilon
MTKPKLHLTIISQDKQLLSTEVESITAPTVEGEITILPGHVPLLSKLQVGELRFRNNEEESSFVISRGFIDVRPDNTVQVMVDVATHEREISIEKAEAAMKAAHETMATTTDRRELLLAEASLKRTLLEIKVAQKTKRTRI